MFDDEISQAIILEHHRKPRCVGVCEDATALEESTNPACGDEIAISIRWEGEVLACALFEGQGCAVSQAGASLLLGQVGGKSRDEVRDVLAEFEKMMRGDEADFSVLGNAAALGMVKAFPDRVVCASMAARILMPIL